MKIRSSFVSNSSTCSFVVLGWEIKGSMARVVEEHFGLDLEDDDYWDEMYNHEELHYYNECGEYLGIEIAHMGCDDYEISSNKISYKCLQKKMAELAELAEELGLNPETAELFSGSYGC